MLSSRGKRCKLANQLSELDQLIDWSVLVEEISEIDKTDRKIGGRPRTNPLWMIKAIFLQHLFSLSDPQLEDQLIDRLSFQHLSGLVWINPESFRDCFTTFWRFKEALVRNGLDQKIFERVNEGLGEQGLFLKKGTTWMR